MIENGEYLSSSVKAPEEQVDPLLNIDDELLEEFGDAVLCTICVPVTEETFRVRLGRFINDLKTAGDPDCLKPWREVPYKEVEITLADTVDFIKRRQAGEKLSNLERTRLDAGCIGIYFTALLSQGKDLVFKKRQT